MVDVEVGRLSPDFFRGVGVAVATLAVGLLVIGIQLLVTCESGGGFDSGVVGCTYPFQAWGVGFLYASAVVAIISANLFAVSIQIPASRKADVKRRYVRSLLVCGVLGASLMVLLIVVHLG